MISFLVTLVHFARAVWHGLRDPEFRGILFLLVVILLAGTLFYANVEQWSWLDALYFSVITLTTVGYGDLAPKHPVAKVFTMIYLLIGIGILLAFVDKVARNAIAARQPRRQARDGDQSQPRQNQ